MNVKIYAEGGGEGQLLDILFRRGWNAFFQGAGLAGRMPRVVRGKGRDRTFNMFLTAVMNPKSDEIPFLLVDCEDTFVTGQTVWQYLKSRDDWDRPTGVDDDQAFLMVQVMETWFLADRAMLRNHFGPLLREQHLPEWPTLETVPKDSVLKALDRATAGCTRPYSKGRISYEILAKLNPEVVEQKCSHAHRLLDCLRRL